MSESDGKSYRWDMVFDPARPGDLSDYAALRNLFEPYNSNSESVMSRIGAIYYEPVQEDEMETSFGLRKFWTIPYTQKVPFHLQVEGNVKLTGVILTRGDDDSATIIVTHQRFGSGVARGGSCTHATLVPLSCSALC